MFSSLLFIALLLISTSISFSVPKSPSLKRHSELKAGFGSKSPTSSGFGGSKGKNKGNLNKSKSSSGSDLRKLALLYDSIIKITSKEKIKDVYVLDTAAAPGKGENGDVKEIGMFWFVGKIASREDSEDPEVLVSSSSSHKGTIYSHAKNLVLKLRQSHKLSLFTAPGNTEMNVVRNLVELTPLLAVPPSSSSLEGQELGFNPEIYVGDELLKGGLRGEIRRGAKEE